VSTTVEMMESALRQAGLDTYYSANLSMARLITRQPAFLAWVEEMETLDERIREVLDIFFTYGDTPHTCEGDREARRSCMACLYIELNKALAPGWSPDGSAAVRPDGG
jgi:hypothetical protein